MKKIILLICNFFIVFSLAFSLNSDYKVIYSDNGNGKLDINTATYEEMLKAGVAPSYVSKIIDFRNLKGGIESIDELDKISGIGKKTCKKLEKYFFVEENYKIKPLEINKADKDLLKYYGFSNEEIKAIEKFKKENKYIRTNVELKKILSQKTYNKYKDLFRYNRY